MQVNPKNSGLDYKKSYSLCLSAYWLFFIKNLRTQIEYKVSYARLI